MRSSGTIRLHLLALGALCAITFFVGLTTHGLTNWQEAQRALVAREMAARGDWLVPTINGEPYLAKPPMIYWAQLALAGLRGGEPGALDLRLAVALAATVGILATYFIGRRILADALPAESGPDAARIGAFWAAATLGTGILYVRSGRIGELDILLVPFVVLAVGWVWGVGKRAESTDQRSGVRPPLTLPQSLLAALPAAAAATGAILTKGPPGLLVIALAAYGSTILNSAWRGDASPRRGTRGWIGAGMGLAAAIALSVVAAPAPGSVNEVLGLMLLAGGLAWVGAEIARANWPDVLRIWSRTHPVIVLGVPLLALWGWSRLVARRIGEEAVRAAAVDEAGENLRLWVLESPVRNLEGAAYGVGLASILAIITLIWLARRRPALGPGWAVLAAWLGLSLLAFSALGKGVPRYLTPVWPAIALVGGLGVAMAAGGKFRVQSSKFKWGAEARRLRVGLGVTVALLAVGQGLWYGYGREALYPWRSPRALLAELSGAGYSANELPPLTLDIWTPALDYYAGAHAQSYASDAPSVAVAGVHPRPLEQLRADLEAAAAAGAPHSPWRIMLIRETPHPEGPEIPPLERLHRAGLMTQTLPVESEWRIDNNRTRVVAVRVAPAPG